MKNLIKSLFICGLFLLLNPTLSNAYNNSWSQYEDITTPDNDTPCTNKCGCNPDGSPKSCECSPNVCCINFGGGGNDSGGNPGSDKGSPVYLKSGFFTWAETDISLISKPTVKLTRNFTAFDPHLGLFGNSWISNIEKIFLKTIKYSKDVSDAQQSDLYYIFRQPDSSRFFYKYNEENSTFVDVGKIRVKATKVDERTSVLTYTNGMKETYKDGYLIKQEDQSGNSINIIYNSDYLPQQIKNGDVSLDFIYNSNGFVSQVTDQSGRSWQYNYDENGNLIEVVNPLGDITTYTYKEHKFSNDAQIYYLIESITDATGKKIIDVTYDTKGRVATYTEGSLTYTYNYKNATTVIKTDNSGNTITYTLNDSGYITKVVDSANRTTQESYDENSRISTTIDPNGNKWQKELDAQGRVVATTDPLGNKTTYSYQGDNTRPSTITTPLGHTTTITYDDKNRPTIIKDANGNTQSFTYDTKGNITEITDAKGNKTTITYNTNNQPTTITNALGDSISIAYDDLGRKSSLTDEEGRVTTYNYDELGRVTKITDAIGNVVEYSYDKAGRLISLKDPIGNETKYTYDEFGRLSTTTRPDGGVTKYTYNTDNTIASVTRRDGKVVTYTYDKAKRPISQSIDNDTVTYAYDAMGNVISATNFNGTVTFTYDAAGRLVSENQFGIDVKTTYDNDSLVKTLAYLTKNVSYTRDNLGASTTINDMAFAYDKNGVQTTLSYPNQTQEKKSFDALYNIKQIETANQTLSYTHDKTGLITSKNNTNYTYDNIGRLTGAGGESFVYDKAGNNLNNSAVYNALNNQMRENALYKLTYDASGNLQTKLNKLTNETTTYSFNARNQLISYTKTDVNNQILKTLTFTYDALGRRVSKTEDNTTQKYLYDGDDIVAILDTQNNPIATITHDESIDTPLSITNANGTFYYHRDHQGSIIALTDESGNVVESFTYDNHYGTIINHTKTIETNNPYGYTGRELDTDDLYYYRARYYDATMQRFLSEDPIGFSSGDFNWYRYVGNSPVSFVDPLGLKLEASIELGAKIYQNSSELYEKIEECNNAVYHSINSDDDMLAHYTDYQKNVNDRRKAVTKAGKGILEAINDFFFSSVEETIMKKIPINEEITKKMDINQAMIQYSMNNE